MRLGCFSSVRNYIRLQIDPIQISNFLAIYYSPEPFWIHKLVGVEEKAMLI